MPATSAPGPAGQRPCCWSSASGWSWSRIRGRSGSAASTRTAGSDGGPPPWTSADVDRMTGPSQGGQPVIDTHGLAKRYGHTDALIDLTLRVDAGEVFGFLGPNGAG